MSRFAPPERAQAVRPPPDPRRIRLASLFIGLCVLLVTAGIYLQRPQLLEDVEGRMLDARFRLRGAEAPTQLVAVVAVDERSLAEVGRWPWTRGRVGALIERIAEAGATTIALDIVFAEPEPDPLRQRLTDLPETVRGPLAATLPPSPDDALAGSLLRAGNVVTGHFFYTTAEQAGSPPAPPDASAAARLGDSQVTAVRAPAAGFPLPEAVAASGNIPLIAAAGNGSGFFSVPPGPDGIVRHAPLLLRYGEAVYPSLALKALAHYLDRAPIVVHAEPYGVTHVNVGDLELPTDEAGSLMVNYRGPGGTLPTWSAAAVLAGELPADALEGRLVILGVTALGAGDVHSTPFGPVFPGVEIQANVVENLIVGDALHRTALARVAELAAMALLVFSLAVGLPRLKRTLGRALLAGGLLVGYLLLDYWLFVARDYWLVLVYPALAWLLTYLGVTLYLTFAVEHRYSTIRSAFQSCLHPLLVDELTQRPELLRFGGEQRRLTVLFSDIRSFTNLSETLTPAQLARFINCYMDPMTAAVLEHNGTLDKYIGDAVMAIFGAPVPRETHAADACRAALTMLRRLDQVEPCCPELKHIFPIHIGIGLHTGDMVVGNLGSSYRFSYTVLGDNVNLGSRLEGLTKQYGVYVIVSEETRQAAGAGFTFRELDRVRVKGKERPVRIFELRGERADAEDTAFLARWEEALAAYRAQRWDQAEAGFAALAELHGDGASRLYLERCESARGTDLPADWDGVTTFTIK